MVNESYTDNTCNDPKGSLIIILKNSIKIMFSTFQNYAKLSFDDLSAYYPRLARTVIKRVKIFNKAIFVEMFAIMVQFYKRFVVTGCSLLLLALASVILLFLVLVYSIINNLKRFWKGNLRVSVKEYLTLYKNLLGTVILALGINLVVTMRYTLDMRATEYLVQSTMHGILYASSILSLAFIVVNRANIALLVPRIKSKAYLGLLTIFFVLALLLVFDCLNSQFFSIGIASVSCYYVVNKRMELIDLLDRIDNNTLSGSEYYKVNDDYKDKDLPYYERILSLVKNFLVEKEKQLTGSK